MITCDQCGSDNTLDGWATEDVNDHTRVWFCVDCGARGFEDLEADEDDESSSPNAFLSDVEQS